MGSSHTIIRYLLRAQVMWRRNNLTNHHRLLPRFSAWDVNQWCCGCLGRKKPQLSTCLRKNRTPIWWRAFNPLETWQFFQYWKKLDHLFRQGWKFSKCLKPTPIYQPMINWWYGARWFGFLGSPYEWDCDLGVSRCESQTTNLPLSWVYFLSEKKMKIKFLLDNSSLVGGWTNPFKKKSSSIWIIFPRVSG